MAEIGPEHPRYERWIRYFEAREKQAGVVAGKFSELAEPVKARPGYAERQAAMDQRISQELVDHEDEGMSDPLDRMLQERLDQADSRGEPIRACLLPNGKLRVPVVRIAHCGLIHDDTDDIGPDDPPWARWVGTARSATLGDLRSGPETLWFNADRRHRDGLSVDEIADEFGMPRNLIAETLAGGWPGV